MNALQIVPSTPSALQWMEMNHLHMVREATEYSSKSVPLWSSVAVVPFLALGALTTNPAIAFNTYIDSGCTNPAISLDRLALDWPDEENGDLASFLEFMDTQLVAHPEWIAPADESQLDRLSQLLANVKV
jgi:hypothetical protein